MRKIRLANTSYPLEGCFQLLRELPFIEYEENVASENARKLHEEEVDLALISSSQFAIHGGYLGLDFGVICRESSSLVRLFSHQPPKRLSTIYVHDRSSASGLLLRMLLRKYWDASPRLVRGSAGLDPHELTENEGMLVRQDMYDACRPVFSVETDLVAEWAALSGKPYVFLVWATRPGVLSLDQIQQLNSVFHREALAERVSADTDCDDDRPSREVVSYYFDSPTTAVLNTQLEEAHELNLLPYASYQTSTFRLLDQKPREQVIRRSVPRILEEVIDGKRISIEDGVRLAREASLADLGLAADMVRTNLFAERSVGYVYVASGDRKELMSHAKKAVEFGSQRILLLPSPPLLESIEEAESLLVDLKSRCRLEIEGFGVPHLLRLAERSNRSIEEVIGRLITAGLDAVPAFGGGMLIDQIMRRKGYQNFGAADWLRAIRWVHRCGARSSGCLVVSPEESWQDRMIHLQKLRMLQDENPGFRFFFCQLAPDCGESVNPQLKLRATSVARLFLDNIPAVLETETTTDPVRALLSLCFGGSKIRLQVGTLYQQSVQEAMQMLRELSLAGFDLCKDSLNATRADKQSRNLH